MSLSVAFLALIDRPISLIKRREEVNRSTFNDLLSPAMANFERRQYFFRTASDVSGATTSARCD
jgi:hypothetical protein